MYELGFLHLVSNVAFMAAIKTEQDGQSSKSLLILVVSFWTVFFYSPTRECKNHQ